MKEYKVTKQQQQELSVPSSDCVKPDKPFIPDKYSCQIELKKLNGKNYFNKAFLELGYQGFGEKDVRRCANITATVENIIVWHKVLPTYTEGDVVYI